MNIKFSVVIPLYNKSKYIERALTSIYAQQLPVDEIIVVDDGSSDNSAAIVETYVVEKSLDNLRVVAQANQGVSVARNNGIALAQNEWVLLLDADDQWLPNFTQEIAQLITQFPDAKMCSTAYSFFDGKHATPANLQHVPSERGYIEDYFKSCCHADLPVTASSVAIAKSAIETVGEFVVGMKMGEDQLMWSRIACQFPIAYSPVNCVYYDKAVQDSACKVNLITEPAPHLAYWLNDLNQGKVPKVLTESLSYLMHLSILYSVKNNLLLGRKAEARTLLQSNSMLKRDKYWYIASLLTYCPNFFIKRML